MDRRHSASPSASPEKLLVDIGAALHPKTGAKERVRLQMRSKMVSAPELLRAAVHQVRPAQAVQKRVWKHITGAASVVALPVWEQLRQALSPDPVLRRRVWAHITGQMQPVYARALVSRPLKIIAAFAVLLLTVRLSPVLFLAPTTVAESAITVQPTKGQVEILIGGLWQPLQGELLLHQPAVLQTQDSEATIMLHDDAVIRMAAHTTLALNDTADRPEPSLTQPTLALQRGTVWVLGLVPRGVDGISIGTSQGRVTVQEGSVSIAQEGPQIAVQVWYRGASVARRGQQMALVAGEEVMLTRSPAAVIGTIDAAAYEDAWVNRNVAMDAAHQHEIAELQQQRRAANAGILPDSTLYPAKRFAEAVDVLFTFTSEARAKKLLTQANTRFDEAAALLTRGTGSDATGPLREYKETLLAVASGAIKSPEVEELVRQDLEAASAGVAAALPDDPAYALKQAVRGAIAALPETAANSSVQSQSQVSELFDELAAVKHRADSGETQDAKADLQKIQTALPLDGTGSQLSADVRKEVEAAIFTISAAVNDRAAGAVIKLEPELPSRATQRTLDRIANRGRSSSSVEPDPLNADEIAVIVLQIRNRVVEGYSSPEGREGQLRLEVNRLEHYPDADEAKILQELYQTLRPYGLGMDVRDAMQ